MPALSAKRIVRVARANYVTEAVRSTAQDALALKRIAAVMQREISRCTTADLRAAEKLASWLTELEQLEANCQTAMDAEDDSRKWNTLDNLVSDIDGYIDTIRHAFRQCAATDKVRVKKPQKGRPGVVVATVQTRLREIRVDAKELAKQLRGLEKSLDAALDSFESVIAEVEDEDVLREWDPKIQDLIESGSNVSEALAVVGDTLRSL